MMRRSLGFRVRPNYHWCSLFLRELATVVSTFLIRPRDSQVSKDLVLKKSRVREERSRTLRRPRHPSIFATTVFLSESYDEALLAEMEYDGPGGGDEL